MASETLTAQRQRELTWSPGFEREFSRIFGAREFFWVGAPALPPRTSLAAPVPGTAPPPEVRGWAKSAHSPQGSAPSLVAHSPQLLERKRWQFWARAKVVRTMALALTACSFLGCTHAHRLTFDNSGPSLTVHKPALYPETIEYNPKRGTFLLSSFREGAIYEVDQSGNAALLVDDPRLCSVLGIAVDATRGRLWAVNSDLGASTKPSAAGPKQLAGVGIYDLSTGKPLTYVDLGPLAAGPHLMNGIALDSAGNGYITDSFSPIIYKIDARGNATIFLKDEQFAGEGINLNGVAVHPDGYLLVIKKSDGALFKVPLAHPTQFSKVAINERFVGGDGITLIDGKDLVLVANRTPTATSNAAYSLTSQDGWASAKLSAVQPLGDVYPTTAVLRDGTLYVLHSKLNELIQSSAEQKGLLRMEATIRPIARVGR